MGILLAHQHQWLTPLLYPTLDAAAVTTLGGLAEWVFEYATPAGTTGKSADHVHQIHPTRLRCPFPQARMLHEFAGFQRPDGTLRKRTLERGLQQLLTRGVIRATYRVDDATRRPETSPTFELIGWIEPTLARAVALHDVTAHLKRFPVAVVMIDGVEPGSAPLHGTTRKRREFERTVEVHRPTTAEEAATLLLRRVEVEWEGKLGSVIHPEWQPDGFRTAELLYETAEGLTGQPVHRTPLPPVRYQGSRPVVTDELLTYLPALGMLPPRMRAEPGPEAAPTPTQRSRARAKGDGINLPDNLRALIPDFGGTAA